MTDFNPRYLKDYCPPAFTIDTVDLCVELDDHKTQVTATYQVIRQGEHLQALTLDGEALKLLSVKVDQRLLKQSDYQLAEEQLIIPTTAQQFTLELVTEIDPVGNTALEGLFKSGDAFCTQCEAEGFRRISYFLDRPDVMAIYTTKIIADKLAYPFLLANGNKIEQGELSDGRHFAVWHDPYKKPCYLFALVAGDFDLLNDSYQTASGRNVKLEIFVDRGNLHKAHHAMASLKKSMMWDEQVFGLEYDLDIYMIVAVDFFNMGAMENKGLNVFNSKYVLADEQSATDSDYFNIESVIAHEYFHNWTGNRVTCRDWFQLSLKEGLTVFRDQQFSADMHSAAVTRIQNVRNLRSLQFPEDSGPMAHPIRPEKVMEMNNFYTMTVYEKGAEVIRMIHTLLGQQKFRQGMDLYFQRFDGMAVTCDDFVNAMADASGVDLTLFKRWYQQSGTPVLSVDENYDSENQRYQLTLTQHTPATSTQPEKQALVLPVNIELLAEDGQSLHRELITLTTEQHTWTFDRIAQQPTLALLGNFSAPVKVNFAQSDQQLITQMVHAHDAFSRWDAGQRLMISYIKQFTLSGPEAVPAKVIDAFRNVLISDSDKALIAEQLTLPGFDEIAELIEQVDPQRLVSAIEHFAQQLANALNADFLSVYQANQDESYQQGSDAIARRALKNVCLSFLARTKETSTHCVLQQNSSDNMTDSLAALKSAAVNGLGEFNALMMSFEQQWSNVTLVMDKWFMLMAIQQRDDIFEQLNRLLKHPLFTLNNPNRARSLIGSFAMANPKYFHCPSGQGYQFLAEQIIALNTINPQVAARMITPLIQYKGFNETHRQLMIAALQRINNTDKLSKDLKEKLTAALS